MTPKQSPTSGPTPNRPAQTAPIGQREPDEWYHYFNEFGQYVHSVVRWYETENSGKAFRQGVCHLKGPDGVPNELWSYLKSRTLDGYPRVPYRLPELLQYFAEGPEATAVWCEGEKDVECLRKLGVVATTSSQGAAGFRQLIESGELDRFHGKRFLIWPDADATGHLYGAEIINALRRAGAEVVGVIRSAGGHKDAADHVAAGLAVSEPGTVYVAHIDRPNTITPAQWADQVLAETNESNQTDDPLRHDDDGAARGQELSPVETHPESFEPQMQRTEVDIRRDGHVVAEELLSELLLPGRAEALGLFRLDEFLVRVRRGRSSVMNRDDVDSLFLSLFEFVRPGLGGTVPAELPRRVQNVVTSRLVDRLPELRGLVSWPIIAQDGTVRTQAGFDPASGYYLLSGLSVGIPESPSRREVDEAVRFVMTELFTDTPFASEDDQLHALAALFTLLLRHLFPLAPMFVFDANESGAGKGLLVNSFTTLITGERMHVENWPRSEDEQNKLVTATLLAGQSIFLLDELRTPGGTAMKSLLTGDYWTGRLLGSSTKVRIRNSLTVFSTANNVEILDDMQRRIVRIRLEADENPYLRDGFRHPNMLGWITEHREQLLEALLTIARGYFQAGKPMPTCGALGSFEEWREIVGGLVEWATGRPILNNRKDWAPGADDVTAQTHAFLDWIDRTFAGRTFFAADVFDAMQRNHLAPKPSCTITSGQDLGHYLRRSRDRWINGLRVVSDGRTGGTTRWIIEKKIDPAQSILDEDGHPVGGAAQNEA